MVERPTDPRTEDRISFELLRTDRASGGSEVVGAATFHEGRSTVEAPEAVAVAVRELLGRAFVDRVQADERPRGYRRSGRGQVDMLVPGMAEHFIARMRGLWLPYPDGTVVTARGAVAAPPPRAHPTEAAELPGVAVTDPSVRRVTQAESDQVLSARPLVQANPPVIGLRPPSKRRDVKRTDCGWIS
jgi:hypothetical protein